MMFSMLANLLSISAFMCERVLVEQDGVTSAIRIIENVNLVGDSMGQLNVIVIAKNQDRASGKWIARVFIKESDGRATEAFGKPLTIHYEGVGSAPFASAMFVLTFSVGPSTKSGLNWFPLLLDEEVAIRIPFTVSRIQPHDLLTPPQKPE